MHSSLEGIWGTTGKSNVAHLLHIITLLNSLSSGVIVGLEVLSLRKCTGNS